MATDGPGRPPGAPRRKHFDAENVTDEIRRRQDEEDDDVPTPPSSLALDPQPSAARSGREQMKQRRRQRPVGPEISAGDEDADWMSGYFVGDETPSGDNPTPGQVNADEVGRALGDEYEDNEELRSAEKIGKRDRDRWEMNPASSEDYQERTAETAPKKRTRRR